MAKSADQNYPSTPLRVFDKHITKTEGVTLNSIANPMPFGGAPSQGQAPLGGFVIWNLRICDLFVIWDL
jgi:hypothetical protein